MKLIDTNVFLYARGRPHAYQEPCRALIMRVAQQPNAFGVDVELLQEVLHFYWGRKDLATGFSLFSDISALCPDPEPITGTIITEARRILEANPILSPRDAVHAAVVLNRRLEGLVTTDRGFRAVAGLQVWDPTELL